MIEPSLRSLHFVTKFLQKIYMDIGLITVSVLCRGSATNLKDLHHLENMNLHCSVIVIIVKIYKTVILQFVWVRNLVSQFGGETQTGGF
jgi:hypothetical protein